MRVTSAEFVHGLSAKLARGLAGGKQDRVELKVTQMLGNEAVVDGMSEASGVGEKLVVFTDSLRLRTPRPPPAANQLCDEKVCAALEIESAALWAPGASLDATRLRIQSAPFQVPFPDSTAAFIDQLQLEARPLFRIHSSLAPRSSAHSQSLRANRRSLYRKPRFHVTASAAELVNPLQNDTRIDSKLLPALLSKS